MKKIFTILAAVLFAGSMMADEAIISWNLGINGAPATGANAITGASGSAAEGFTIAISGNADKSWSSGNGDLTYNEVTYKTLKNSNGAQNTITLPANSTASKVVFYVVSNADSDAKLSEFNGEACNDAVTSHKDYSNPTVITKSLNNVESFTFTFSTKQVCFIAVVTYSAGAILDPVTEVTISGATEGFVGRTITLSATTDVKADSIYWIVDGSVQESHTASLDLELIEERTYGVVCFARNANNAEDQFAESAIHEVVSTVKPVLDQVDVTESTVWDWTKAASVAEIKFTDATTPAKNEEVLLANVDDYKNDANFNSQALIFSGEYAIRGGSYCQGQRLKFHTTVAGTVRVEFSNTGGGDDRPKRYVAVNGNVDKTVGSDTADKATSANIPVAAGDVTIEGSFEEYQLQYLRIYSVTFTKSTPTAVDNTEAGVKAVKVIRDGQMLIEKGGKVYNAQGIEVK